MENRKYQRVLLKSVPSHPKVEQSTTLSPFGVLTIETSSQRQRFLTVSCLHICDCNKTDIYIPLPNVCRPGPNFPKWKKKSGEKKIRRSLKKKPNKLKAKTL